MEKRNTVERGEGEATDPERFEKICDAQGSFHGIELLGSVGFGQIRGFGRDQSGWEMISLGRWLKVEVGR